LKIFKIFNDLTTAEAREKKHAELEPFDWARKKHSSLFARSLRHEGKKVFITFKPGVNVTKLLPSSLDCEVKIS
jgi:hypothetical protein